MDSFYDLKTSWIRRLNPFMAEGAIFCKHDIPVCETTAISLPVKQITWREAKQIHDEHMRKEEWDYHEDAFINFYLCDDCFNDRDGVWDKPQRALKIIQHFGGIITPDFSMCQDIPEGFKITFVYMMRVFGHWCGRNGVEVINNVRWGTEETYDYCFEGIPKHGVVCIGTVGGGPWELDDRDRFEKGFMEMIRRIKPVTILVYGSDRGRCFDLAKKMGIAVIRYRSRTDLVFRERRGDE